MADIQTLTSPQQTEPSSPCCAECGVSATDSTLESDEDSQLYCAECWETYYGTLIAASESLIEFASAFRAASTDLSPWTPSPLPVYPDQYLQSLFEDDFDLGSAATSDCVVVPILDYCSECGTSATESKLEADEDGQYYCTECWELHYSALNVVAELAEDEEELPAPLPASTPPMARSDSMPSLIDLPSEEPITVVVPSTQCCVECGASERESKLVLDDDGEYYCTDCWDDFLSIPSADTGAGSEALWLPD